MRSLAPTHGRRPVRGTPGLSRQPQLSERRQPVCRAQSLGATVRAWFSGVFSQAPVQRGQEVGMRSSERASTVERSDEAASTSSKAGERISAVEEERAKLKEGELMATTHKSIDEFTREEWDACVHAADELNPFLLYDFLDSLEHSQSAVGSTGWMPQHLALRDSSGRLHAAVPLYIKSHSYGEYVFDHSWANLYAQLGERYYPKLQSCVPFTPVTGPRVLVAPGEDQQKLRKVMLQALMQLPASYKLSSIHITFNTEEEWKAARDMGWLSQIDLQYHWDNDGYKTFDDFLAQLKTSKRKSIRQERRGVAKQGLTVRRLRGAEITPDVWDKFYDFYIDTSDRKWGSAYLTRSFFKRLAETMGDRVMLMAAYDENRDGELVAGALNLVGSKALYGRNWGCRSGSFYKYLHFELCYYQAIDAAIELGLERVEAGAQGQHKISRGYLPTMTYSSHLLMNPGAAALVRRYLKRNAIDVEATIDGLTEIASPFKEERQSLNDALSDIRASAERQARENDSEE